MLQIGFVGRKGPGGQKRVRAQCKIEVGCATVPGNAKNDLI